MLSRIRTTKFNHSPYGFDPCVDKETGAKLCQCLFDVYYDINDNTHREVNNILRDECCTFSCISEDIKSQLETRLDTSPLLDENITINDNDKSCTIDRETFNFNYDNERSGCYYKLLQETNENSNQDAAKRALKQAVQNGVEVDTGGLPGQ